MSAPVQRPRRTTNSVTVNDVARAAGVSPMTVSRALNRPGSVDAAMEARVREAVARLAYVPNPMARGLRGSQSRLVAAVFPTLGGPIFLQMIESLGRHLSAMDHQLLVGQGGYRDSREEQLLADLISRRPDGIVLTGVAHTAKARSRLIASGIPVVETWDLSQHPIGLLVGFSHEAVGRAACDFFHARGRRRLAYVGGDDERSMRRAAAFCQRAEQLTGQTTTSRHVAAPATLAHGRGTLREMMSGVRRVDAIFCSSDLLAIGLLTEARKLGIRVPDDLAVMGFGDLDMARDFSPAISTVRIDTDRMGRIAAGWIVEQALPPPLTAPVVDVGFVLVQRQST